MKLANCTIKKLYAAKFYFVKRLEFCRRIHLMYLLFSIDCFFLPNLWCFLEIIEQKIINSYF